MIRQFRLYTDVHDVPMEWNILGLRVPSLAVVILAVDFALALITAQILNRTLLDGGGREELLAYVYPAVPAVLIALILLALIYRINLASSLPAKTQLKLMRDYARNPHVCNLPYDPD